MAKRFVSGSGLHRKIRAIFEAINPGSSRASVSRPPLNQMWGQPLEQRVMMSANIVTVDWQGHSFPAYQGQYVAVTQHQNLLQSLASKEGFTNLKSLGGGGYYSFDSDLPVSTLEKLAAKDTATFKTLSPDGISHLASTVPDDAEIANQWGLINTGQTETYDYNGDGVVTPSANYPTPPYPNENQVGTPGQDIHASSAWDINTGSKNVVVAILDSGIDLTHPDLAANVWTNPLDTVANNDNGDGFPDDVNGWNFTTNTNSVQDTYGHGTAVAGVIGASGNNQIGISGVAWNVSLLPVVVADDTGAVSDSNEIQGINYVVMLKNMGINIVVMNQSIGDSNVYPQDLLVANAIKQATKIGILDVVAAGNDGAPISAAGVNIDASGYTPATYGLSNANIITVAATDNLGQLASFSNYGATAVDLAAPGVDIYTTSPVLQSTLSSTLALDNPDIPQFGTSYGYLSGTSMAAPFVTGIIALEASANPSATPAQLKQALLGGVTFDPSLAAVNGLPAKVATSGVANAYNALLNILNDYVSTDTNRQGSWSGFYGSNGAYVVGESTAFPSFVTVDQTGGSPVIVSNTTKNLAALELITDPSQRISAYEASAGTESINLDFTDGLVHRTELYLADLDRKRRVETVQLVDNVTGSVLDSRVVSNFTKGEYLIYDLRGNVSLRIINNAGPSAVYSGLFFDPQPSTPTIDVGTDTATTGTNWRNAYGSQGAVVVGNATQLPSYVSGFSVSGETTTVLKATVHNTVGLQKVTDLNSGLEAYYATTTHMDLNLSTSDGLTHTVTLYMADYDHKQRQERVQVINPATGALLAQQDINNFTKGVFVSFQVTGNNIFRIINLGGPSAVVSGIFFDAPFGQKVHYLATDTTTRGNWRESQYGLSSAYVVGDDFPGIDDPTNNLITVTGGTEQILGGPTNNPTALLKTGLTDSTVRVQAYLATSSSMVLAFNPSDLLFHTVALYFADYQNTHRIEGVTIYNPATLQVETSQVIGNFGKGKYMVFDISGEALITISNGGYPNAVLSGVFTN